MYGLIWKATLPDRRRPLAPRKAPRVDDNSFPRRGQLNAIINTAIFSFQYAHRGRRSCRAYCKDARCTTASQTDDLITEHPNESFGAGVSTYDNYTGY